MGSIESEARRIFGARAARYTTSAAHTDPRVLARVVELAAPQEDWRVLDVATGTGHTAFALAPLVRRVIGIDLTAQMLAESWKLQTARNISNVAYALADVQRLPFSAGTFHLVTCRRAAHHFADIGRALGEIHRALRPGGRLVIDDRSAPEDDFADDCMNLLDRYHDGSHVREYRASEWRRLLEVHGFALETVESYLRHRPLSALTTDVSVEDAQKIHALLDALTPQQRATFDLRTVNGELHLNHWYVLLSGTRR